MSEALPGFAVIYRWRIDPAKEESFQNAWADVTELIRDERGGLGSRLHRSADGIWVAYAQWPSRKDWETSQSLGPVDEKASAIMAEAIVGRWDPILLEPVADLLVK